jgi:hypothetical protein
LYTITVRVTDRVGLQAEAQTIVEVSAPETPILTDDDDDDTGEGASGSGGFFFVILLVILIIILILSAMMIFYLQSIRDRGMPEPEPVMFRKKEDVVEVEALEEKPRRSRGKVVERPRRKSRKGSRK